MSAFRYWWNLFKTAETQKVRAGVLDFHVTVSATENTKAITVICLRYQSTIAAATAQFLS